MKLMKRATLLIKTEFGDIKQQKPFTYQEETNGLKQEVESRFVIEEKEQSQIANRKIANQI